MKEEYKRVIFHLIVVVSLTLIGAIGGYHFYKYIGCSIKKSPLNDVGYNVSLWALFGFIMGILILPEKDD